MWQVVSGGFMNPLLLLHNSQLTREQVVAKVVISTFFQKEYDKDKI